MTLIFDPGRNHFEFDLPCNLIFVLFAPFCGYIKNQ